MITVCVHVPNNPILLEIVSFYGSFWFWRVVAAFVHNWILMNNGFTSCLQLVIEVNRVVERMIVLFVLNDRLVESPLG